MENALNSVMHDYLGVSIYLGPYEGGKPDASFSFKDEDFVKVALGKMNPQIAFMRFDLSMEVFVFSPNLFRFSSLFMYSFVCCFCCDMYTGVQ